VLWEKGNAIHKLFPANKSVKFVREIHELILVESQFVVKAKIGCTEINLVWVKLFIERVPFLVNHKLCD